VASNKLVKKIESLNQIVELAKGADETLTEDLREITLETHEKIFDEIEYIESQANLIPTFGALVSSLFADKSQFFRKLAIKLKQTVNRDELNLKLHKEKTKNMILDMDPKKLYQFFKNPKQALTRRLTP